MGLMRKASSGRLLHSFRVDCEVRNSLNPGLLFLQVTAANPQKETGELMGGREGRVGERESGRVGENGRARGKERGGERGDYRGGQTCTF